MEGKEHKKSTPPEIEQRERREHESWKRSLNAILSKKEILQKI
jgi:hypothetical protein